MPNCLPSIIFFFLVGSFLGALVKAYSSEVMEAKISEMAMRM